MAKTKEVVIIEIERFREINMGNYDEYYIGITNDLVRRLNEDNSVLEHITNGIFFKGQDCYTEECESRDEAVAIEQYFQDKGMERKNLAARGASTSKYIYCFKLTEQGIKALNEQVAAKVYSPGVKKFSDILKIK